MTVTATIKAIDPATHSITLRSENGDKDTFTVRPAVTRFRAAQGRRHDQSYLLRITRLSGPKAWCDAGGLRHRPSGRRGWGGGLFRVHTGSGGDLWVPGPPAVVQLQASVQVKSPAKHCKIQQIPSGRIRLI